MMWDICSNILDLCNVVTFGFMYKVEGKKHFFIVNFITFRHLKTSASLPQLHVTPLPPLHPVDLHTKYEELVLSH